MNRFYRIYVGETCQVLLYSMGAMLELQSEEQDVQKLLVRCASATPDGVKTLCRTAEVLSRYGEAAKKALGMEAGEALRAEVLESILTQEDRMALLEAVMETIRRGVSSELSDKYEPEVDVVLEELKKKTGVRTAEPR